MGSHGFLVHSALPFQEAAATRPASAPNAVDYSYKLGSLQTHLTACRKVKHLFYWLDHAAFGKRLSAPGPAKHPVYLEDLPKGAGEYPSLDNCAAKRHMVTAGCALSQYLWLRRAVHDGWQRSSGDTPSMTLPT